MLDSTCPNSKQLFIIFLFDFDFGSIMNMATASGRNLFPDNCTRQVFPSFNLSPLHSLMEKFISEMVLEEVKKKNKEYIGGGEGILRQTRKFKYAELSSNISSFRSKEQCYSQLLYSVFCYLDEYIVMCVIFFHLLQNDFQILVVDMYTNVAVVIVELLSLC